MAKNSMPFGIICRQLRGIFHLPAVAAVSSISGVPVDVDVGSPTQTRNYVVYSRRQGLNAC